MTAGEMPLGAIDRVLLPVVNYNAELSGGKMLSKVMRKALALLLTVICPSSILMADRPSAMLQASGTVRLNGTPSPTSMSVFKGDLIDTAEASVASVSRSGFYVVVDPLSSIRYQDNGFAILKGKTRVRTTNGATVHVGSISLIPVLATTLFDVSSDGVTALVTTREGELTLTDGTETTTLEPGYTAKLSLVGLQAQEEQAPKAAAKGGGQEGQAPKPAAKGGSQKRKRPPAWLIWVIAGGAAFGIVCGLTCGGSGGPPVSPVTP
jgi:hypothetical protein